MANLGSACEVAGAFGALELHAELVDALRDLLHPVERLFLLRPARGEPGVQLLRFGELALERLANVLRLVLHRGELDLELADAPVGFVQLERARVDLHA